MQQDVRRKPKILVVEDEEAVRRVLGAILEHHGFDSCLTASGPEAIATYTAAATDFDVVLLDVQMPHCDGVQTLLALQKVDPRVRVVFISGSTGEYSQEDLKHLGAFHVVQKPPDLTQLKDILWHVIEQSSSGGAPGTIGSNATATSSDKASPAMAIASPAANRRIAPRRQAAVGTLCSIDTNGVPGQDGLVWNLSASGVSMLLHEPLKADAVVSAQLRTLDEQSSLPIQLRIVHVRKIRTGDYFLGAQFQRALAADELRPFLADA
jgi:CheY-like chemotaxis protein